MTPTRLAVLASGSGSNFEAITRYFASPAAHVQDHHQRVEVALLLSNDPAARAIARAAVHGVATGVLRDHRDGDELLGLLRSHDIRMVALAGYLKLVPVNVVRAFSNMIVNIHPALLPLHGGQGMYGLRVHQAVLDARESVSGATVHFVSEEYDRGAILAQGRVRVLPGDSADTLAARVLTLEHILYPLTIDCLANGTISAANPVVVPEGVDPRAYIKNTEKTH